MCFTWSKTKLLIICLLHGPHVISFPEITMSWIVFIILRKIIKIVVMVWLDPDLKCIYSSRRFQITLRFVASFHIDKDNYLENSVWRFRVEESYHYIVYNKHDKYGNLVQFSDNILYASVVLSITVPRDRAKLKDYFYVCELHWICLFQ